MAVPVQTWGSLGSMVAEQREFGAKSAEYLESNEIYDLFGHLLREVIVHQPTDPIKFLQEQLRNPPALSIAVMGPSGIKRSKYCAQLAADFNIKHIHVGKLLRQKKELKETIEMGNLVDDNIVIPIVKAEVRKVKGEGYVLDGFPRTKIQAHVLSQKEMAFSLDNIILLNAGQRAIKEAFATKYASADGTEADQEIINVRLQQYTRHIVGIAELFVNIIRQIEVSVGDDDQNVNYDTIRSNIHMRPTAHAPLRPHRICVVGPLGSGRTTQSKAIAKQYGLVHVDLAALLRKQQKESGQELEDIPPEYMSDEDLCAAAGRRLRETDCIRKGWVLDGFPKTQAQAEFLRQSHSWPTRIINLKVEEETIAARVGARRLDPVTCTAYYRSPNSVAIRQRLVQTEHDLPKAVKERYAMHMENIERTLQTFPLVSSTISGVTDITTVTRHVQQKIDTPLPNEDVARASDA
eukprot:TRINITY_DN12344_c1_g1_i1.p1 TRINITY_DN12344_c1_g1~~TRINITY_DN12344_c1_g1_i1.p1  ORF type:complete len:496 (-),score=109.46 TRINITY_DN12344_c1_g1_i1:60-1451(-)